MDPHTKPTVVFDYDDVLVDCAPALAQVIADHLGDQSLVNDHEKWTSFTISHHYPQIDNLRDQIFMRMHEEGVMTRLPLKRAYPYLLRRLHTEGVKIVLITARSWIPGGFDVTKTHIEENGLPYDQLIVSSSIKTKRLSIPSDTWVYFDDNAHNILECARYTKHAVLVSKPWNEYFVAEPGSNILRMRDPDDVSNDIDLNAWADSVLAFLREHTPNTR